MWLTATALASAHDSVIHAGTLIDGVSNEARQQVSIQIYDEHIASVESGFLAPAGAKVIDWSNSTVMPGFIDCHVQISAMLPGQTNAIEDRLTHTDLDRAFDGAVFAAAMLQQGFTSARDVGGGDDTVALRNAINAGKVPGPRLWVWLEPLGPTGGNADPRSRLDCFLADRNWDNGIVDTPDESRLRVREHKRRGADLIKMLPSGGMASSGDDPRQQMMTNEEMRVVVETAHGLGMKVAAHIYPPGAIESAVRSGVDSVEHRSFATAQTFALMKEHGTHLVPTLSVYEIYYEAATHHPELLTPGTVAKEIANELLPKRNLALAIRSGVKIAFGSDTGEGDHTMEFALLIANGMTPDDALAAATRNAADLLGASDRVGAIQAGRFADIVATASDPRKDAAQFRRVELVMKGGVIYRQHGAPVAH